MIVDLGNVDYISSAGWGIFISEIKSIRENGGDLKLVSMVPDVYEIFELLEFHHILDVYDSIDEAINKFEVLESYRPTGCKGSYFQETRTCRRNHKYHPLRSCQATETAVDPEPKEEPVQQDQTEIMRAELPLSEKIKMIVKRILSMVLSRSKRN